MTNHIVKQEVLIDASQARVWSKLTDPNETEKYFFKTRVRSEWKEGGPISFRRKILGLFTFKLSGTILKIEKEKLLEYKLMNHKWFGKPSSSEFSIVSIALRADGDKTLVSVSDDVGQYSGASKRYAKSVKGWQKILHGLKSVAEAK